MSDFEGTLDCVIALHNLKVLHKLDLTFDMPERRAAISQEHVFHPLVSEKDVDLKIPADAPDLLRPEYRHIREFKEFLPSAIPVVEKALEKGGDDCVFFPTVLKRGKNLYNGAYVLQLRVQQELLGVWTVKFLVGASYSYETHTGYFQISRDSGIIHSICDCYSG